MAAPSHRALSEWYHQLGQHLQAGLTLSAALHLVSGRPAQLSRHWGESLAGGTPFDHLLRDAPAWLPERDRFVLSAAAGSGRLPQACERLSASHEATARAWSQAVSATIYPLLLLHLAAVLLPWVQSISLSLDGAPVPPAGLPWPVQTALWLSALWGMIVGVAWLLAVHPRRAAAVARWIPGLRGFLRERGLSEVARTLEALLGAGAALDSAWFAAGKSSAHPALEEASWAVVRAVQQGRPPSGAMAAQRCWPSAFLSLYTTGEQTGRLEENLDRLARLHEAQASAALARVAFWFPKLVFLLVAGVVAWTVLSWYAQYFALLDAIQA